MGMDPHMVEALIPIVAIVFGVSFVPAIIFIFKYFKLKDRELQLEADAQKLSQKHFAALEMRLQRLETLVLSMDGTAERLRSLEAPASGQAEPLPPGREPLKLR